MGGGMGGGLGGGFFGSFGCARLHLQPVSALCRVQAPSAQCTAACPRQFAALLVKLLQCDPSAGQLLHTGAGSLQSHTHAGCRGEPSGGYQQQPRARPQPRASEEPSWGPEQEEAWRRRQEQMVRSSSKQTAVQVDCAFCKCKCKH